MPLVKNTNIIYSDLDLSFIPNPNTKDISTLFDENAVKRSIRHALLLNKYDIPFDSTNYSNIKKLLFEPISYVTASVLESNIKYVIQKIDTRIIIQNIKVVENEQSDGYDVYIIYSIKYYQNNSTLKIFLQRTR